MFVAWSSQVAWSPDTCYVASASDDNTIKICDASTGEEKCTLDGHRDPVCFALARSLRLNASCT